VTDVDIKRLGTLLWSHVRNQVSPSVVWQNDIPIMRGIGLSTQGLRMRLLTAPPNDGATEPKDESQGGTGPHVVNRYSAPVIDGAFLLWQRRPRHEYPRHARFWNMRSCNSALSGLVVWR
jgi:hypothetical protein